MKSNELRVGNLVLNKHNEVDIITESLGTCNGVECSIDVNKGTLEIIEVRFKDGELIRFYVK